MPISNLERPFSTTWRTTPVTLADGGAVLLVRLEIGDVVPIVPGAQQFPGPGERVKLGLRVTPQLKQRLDAAAEQNGRSQSQEAEFRLERSFDRVALVPEVLTLEFGKKLAGILMLLGSVMLFADCVDSTSRPKPIAKRTSWESLSDPDGYNEAVEAAVMVLEAIRPKGARTARSGSGVELAEVIIKAVRGDPDAAKNPFTEDAPTIRSLLGSIAERMTAEKPTTPTTLTLAYGEEIAADLMRLGAQMKERRHRRETPFALAAAIYGASHDLEEAFKANQARGLFWPSQEQLIAAFERHLNEFLIPDWQRATPHAAEESEEKAKKRYQAEILQFRRRA
jgi:hypothetical protein